MNTNKRKLWRNIKEYTQWKSKRNNNTNKKKHRLYDFVEDSKKNPQKLEELIEKETLKIFRNSKNSKKEKRTIKKDLI